MPFGRSAIQSNVMLFSCCSSADDGRLFLPLCDMREQSLPTFEFLLMSPIGRVSLKARHVPFPGQLGGNTMMLVEIVTAEAFDPLAHG
jgi:hypothetical protein